MYVEMINGLACCRSIIESHVVTVRLKLNIETTFDVIDQFKHRKSQGRRGLPPIRDNPTGNDQRVARADRETVTYCEGEFVALNPGIMIEI